MNDHHARRPRDLAPEEIAVSEWFQTLDRPDAPAALRERVLSAPVGAARAGRPAGRLLRMVPFGAWGIASAALVLLAVGAAVTVELTTPAPQPAPGYRATFEQHSLIVRNDPAMSLYHDLEIFDEVGLPQGEVIAGWGR